MASRSARRVGVLNAQVIPAQGGDTLWCSLYSLYNTLSEEERAELGNLVVHNAPHPGFVERVVKSLGEKLVEPFLDQYGDGAQHPLVREHYVTGQPLLDHAPCRCLALARVTPHTSMHRELSSRGSLRPQMVPNGCLAIWLPA